MMKGNLYVIKEHQLLAYEINYLPSHNQRVTDRRTDIHVAISITRASIASRVKTLRASHTERC